MARTFCDTITFQMLTVPSNQYQYSGTRPIEGSNGLCYSLKAYRGSFLSTKRCTAYLHLHGGPVFVEVSCFIGNVKKPSPTFRFNTAGETVMHFDYNQKEFEQGNGTITFDLKFTGYNATPVVEETSEVNETSHLLENLTLDNLMYNEKDAKFIVEGQEILFHRGLLFNISPILRVCLDRGTPGIIEVEGFDYDTVKMVVDYCYQREIGLQSDKQILDGLRFTMKYAIFNVAKVLEDIILENIKEANFFEVAEYAWKNKNEKLKTKCAEFLRKHINLVLKKEFVGLDDNIQLDLIKAAQSCK